MLSWSDFIKSILSSFFLWTLQISKNLKAFSLSISSVNERFIILLPFFLNIFFSKRNSLKWSQSLILFHDLILVVLIGLYHLGLLYVYFRSSSECCRSQLSGHDSLIESLLVRTYYLGYFAWDVFLSVVLLSDYFL